MQGSVDRRTVKLADIPVVLRITALLLPAVLLRNRWPLPKLVRLFESAPRSGHDAANLARARRLTDGILHRLFAGAFCMKRALILYHFMTRSDVRGRIVFGVARDGSSLKGHAWLEVDGLPYHESERVSDFKVIYAHPYPHPDSGPQVVTVEGSPGTVGRSDQ